MKALCASKALVHSDVLTYKVKLYIHRLGYYLSIVLPLNLIWDKLHRKNYHPDAAGIKDRIVADRKNPGESLFSWWGHRLKIDFDLKNLSVLEIGHGGAWFLAQALDLGAESATGVEISSELNIRASKVLNELGYRNFQLLLGNGKDLSVLSGRSFDLIFSNTVFQHLPTRTARKYLGEISKLLSEEGFCLIQALLSKTTSYKRLSSADLFSVAYKKEEFANLLIEANLRVSNFAEVEYGSPDTYWGIYLLKRGCGFREL